MTDETMRPSEDADPEFIGDGGDGLYLILTEEEGKWYYSCERFEDCEVVVDCVGPYETLAKAQEAARAYAVAFCHDLGIPLISGAEHGEDDDKVWE